MEEELPVEDDHSPQPREAKPRIRFEMCGSELYSLWQWDEEMRGASP